MIARGDAARRRRPACRSPTARHEHTASPVAAQPATVEAATPPEREHVTTAHATDARIASRSLPIPRVVARPKRKMLRAHNAIRCTVRLAAQCGPLHNATATTAVQRQCDANHQMHLEATVGGLPRGRPQTRAEQTIALQASTRAADPVFGEPARARSIARLDRGHQYGSEASLASAQVAPRMCVRVRVRLPDVDQDTAPTRRNLVGFRRRQSCAPIRCGGYGGVHGHAVRDART